MAREPEGDKYRHDQCLYCAHFVPDGILFCSPECEEKLRDYVPKNCLHCGESFLFRDKTKQKRAKYCSRACYIKDSCGSKHPQWKGGIRKTKKGYVYLYSPTHPNADHNFVAEHRLVVEALLGRYLGSHELVHHKNGIKDDNRLENLEIVLKTTHQGEVVCPHCGERFGIK